LINPDKKDKKMGFWTEPCTYCVQIIDKVIDKIDIVLWEDDSKASDIIGQWLGFLASIIIIGGITLIVWNAIAPFY